MRFIGNMLFGAAHLLLFVAAVAIVVMMVHVSLDITLRLAFSAPLPGTLEITSTYSMVAVSFLPVAHAYATRSNILVEIFTQRLAERAKLKLELIGSALSVLYLGLLAVMGGVIAWHNTMIDETVDATFFELVAWPSRWFVVAGCGVSGLLALWHMVDDCIWLRSGRRTMDGWDPRDEHRLNM